MSPTAIPDRSGRPTESVDRGRGFLLLLFLVLIVGVVNGSNWFVLSRVTSAVDDELGRRLVTVAASAVQAATPELLLSPDVAADDFVRRVLTDVSARHDLAHVVLLDPDGLLLLDLEGDLPGERCRILDGDFSAFTRAAAGAPAASPSFTLDGEVLKAGWAPVEDWDGTVEAVLGVTAGGGFHATIPALRRTLLGIHIGSGALVVVLGAVFFGMSRRLQRTETALARAETLGAMGMMAAGGALEIRTPLAIISGTAERLRRKYAGAGAGAAGGVGAAAGTAPGEPGASHEPDELFDFIPEEVERLNGIIEGYLRFARDEPMTFVECDLVAVLGRTARIVKEEFAGSGVEVEVDGLDRELPGLADPQRLQQVLLNLLLNAAQAMPGGGVVRLSIEANGDDVTIRVEDEGSGFDERRMKGAFTPFFTTKETGSGLGLVMAKRIVEGHGGAIELANRAPRGAVVTVTLPRRAAAPAPIEEC